MSRGKDYRKSLQGFEKVYKPRRDSMTKRRNRRWRRDKLFEIYSKQLELRKGEDMEFYAGKAKLVEGTEECCDRFPKCVHTVWETSCPECQTHLESRGIFGPYTCPVCGTEFMLQVEGWTDGRGELYGSAEKGGD